MNPRRLFTQSRLALALEPRMMFDAAVAATVAEVTTQAQGGSAEPSVSAEGKQVGYAIDAQGHPAGTGVDLFDNVAVTLDSGGEDLDTLVVEVDSYGEGQALVIDGKEISLTPTATPIITDNGYTCSVRVEGGKAIVSIDLYNNTGDGTSPAEAQSLIDGMKYRVLDGEKISSGTVTVTLKGLSDLSDSADLDISAAVAIDNAFNFSPVLDAEGNLNLGQIIYGSTLESVEELAYSADGNYVYAADDKGNICVFSVDESGKLTEIQALGSADIAALSGVKDMQLSADGTTLLVMNTDMDAYASRILSLRIGADGRLSHAGTATLDSMATGLSVSDDGQWIFTSSEYGGVSIFHVEADGSLTKTIPFDVENEWESPLQDWKGAIGVGDYVFVATSSGTCSIEVYQRGEDGNLVALDSVLTDISSYYPDLQFSVSQDGSLLYVTYDAPEEYVFDENWNMTILPAGENSKVLVISFDGERLNILRSASVPFVKDTSVSEDGSTLYASLSDGTVQIYSVSATGELTLLQQVDELNGGSVLGVSGDGNVVVGGDKAITVLTVQQAGLYGEELAFGSGVTLSDANLDALADGDGDYGGASVTIRRSEGADPADTFSFADGDGYTLEGSSIMKEGQTVATFSASGGTLTITFASGATKADANAILHQSRYSNMATSSSDPSVTLQLVANDGEKDSSPVEMTLYLSVNTAPDLTTVPKGTTAYTTHGTTVALFSKTSVDTGEMGQRILELEMTIGGLGSAIGEYLVLDGTTIALHESASGTTTGGFTWSYTVSNGAGTLVLGSATGMSAKAVATLIDGMNYGTSSSATTDGTRTFTLSSIRDDGGTSNSGIDVSSLALSASVSVDINLPPTVDLGEGNAESGFYYNDGRLEGFDGYVNEVEISADGETLIVCGSSSSNGGGTGYLYVFSRDVATGELSLIQTFTQGAADDSGTPAIEVNGLGGISSAAITENGKWVYVAGYADGADSSSYSLALFSRDQTTGELTYVGLVAQQGQGGVTGLGGAISEIVLSEDGNSLYTLNGLNMGMSNSSLSDIGIFTINDADGSLTYRSTYTGGSSDSGVYNPASMVFSPDGTYAYVANYQYSIGVFQRDTTTGELTYVATVNRAYIDAEAASGEGAAYGNNALSNLQDIVMTEDGKFLYVSTYNSATVSMFTRDASTGELHYTGSFATYNVGNVMGMYLRNMIISQDNSTLYIGLYGDNAILVCSIDAETGTLSFKDTIVTNGQTGNLVMARDGGNIYAGSYNITQGLHQVSALPGIPYSGGDIPLGEHIAITDPDFASEANYAGLIVTIERSKGASTDDIFGFAGTTDITVADNTVRYQGASVATISTEGGSFSLTFTGTVSQAVVRGVLDCVTYRNESGTMTTLTVTVNDGEKTASGGIALMVDVNAPSIEADGKGGAYAFDENDLPPTEGVVLFDDVTVALGQDTEGLESLVFTVDATGAQHTLTVDGTAITLTGGSGTTANGYSYSVAVEDGVATLTLGLDGGAHAPADVKALVEGMRYSRSADNLVRETVTVTLVSLADASETTVCNIASAVSVTMPNHAPVVDLPDYELDVVSTNKGESYSVTLPEGMFSDRDGDSLTWSVGGLPEGLTFDPATRTISGTPTESGEFSITITAMDSDADDPKSVSHTVSLTVENRSPVLADASFELENGTYKGDAYTVQLPESLFSDPDGDSLTWAVSGLPAGFQFDPDTRTISGFGTESGDFIVTITATDSDNASVSHTVSLLVENRAPVAGGQNYAPDVAGVGYSYSTILPDSLFTDADGDSLTWDVSGLPEGLEFNPDTRVISGTPVAAGETTITVTVTDTDGETASRTITLIARTNEAPAASDSTVVFENPEQGASFSVTLPENLFTDPDGDALSWEVSGLPEGLRFDADSRTISGVPTVSGTFTLVIRVTDVFGETASRSFVLEVEAATVTLNPESPDRPGGEVSDASDIAGESPFGGSENTRPNLPPNGLDDALPGAGGISFSGSAGMSDMGHVWDAASSAWGMRGAEGGIADGAGAADIWTGEGAYVRSGWSYDVAGNRYVAPLPSATSLGLAEGSVNGYRLVWAGNGKDVGASLRFDMREWHLVSSGARIPDKGELLLILTTSDGKTVRVPIITDNSRDQAAPGVSRSMRNAAPSEEAGGRGGHESPAPSPDRSMENAGILGTMAPGDVLADTGAALTATSEGITEDGSAGVAGKPGLIWQLRQSLGHAPAATGLAETHGDTGRPVARTAA